MVLMLEAEALEVLVMAVTALVVLVALAATRLGMRTVAGAGLVPAPVALCGNLFEAAEADGTLVGGSSRRRHLRTATMQARAALPAAAAEVRFRPSSCL